MIKTIFQKFFQGAGRMKAKELKQHVFKDFIAWMEKNGIKNPNDETSDPFSMDVYMVKVFDVLYEQYINEQKRNQTKRDLVMNFKSEELQEILKARLEAENMARGKNPAPVQKNRDIIPEGDEESGEEGKEDEDAPADNVKDFPKKNG